MSRLLGIVNPAKDPTTQPLEYWLWESGGVLPALGNWDYERLQIYTTPAPDGNVCVWVMGEPSEKYRDGVYLKMHCNPELNPSPRITNSEQDAIRASLEAAQQIRTALVPIMDDQSAAVAAGQVAGR